LSAVIVEMKPDVASVEQTFVNKDPVATLKLGQARAMALFTPASMGLEVFEYAPNQVKKAVVGAGHAAKEQVHHMVKVLLPQAVIAGPDAGDALALAICHAHLGQSANQMAALLATGGVR
jgi:crossover junction endodeoxyribonuclease RuvC